MNTMVLLGLCVVFAGLAFGVLVLRLGHPHHRRIALGIYAVGWLPFFGAPWLHWRFLQQQLLPIPTSESE